MKKLIILMALISLFMAFGVSAIPSSFSANDTSWSNGDPINVTFTDGTNVTNLHISISSPKTANSSTSFVINITNSTATNFNGNGANFTYDSSILLEDSNDYTATYLTTGGTDSSGVSGTQTITIARTTPSAPTTSHKADAEFTEVSGSNTITYTVTGADTTSCRIAFGKRTFTGTNTFAMTHSANSCTYTISKGTIPDGTYMTYARASDETDTAISTGVNFKIKTLEGVAEDDIAAISVPLIKKGVIQVNIAGVLLVVIIGAIVYMAFFKKK